MAKNLDDYMTERWDDKIKEMIYSYFEDNPEEGAELLLGLIESSDPQLKKFGEYTLKNSSILRHMEEELENEWDETHEPDPDADHDKDR